MTKKELLDYVAGFSKEPGSFTEDELYLIGTAHKDLPNNEKNWNELANLVGGWTSGNAYRSWVIRQQAKKGVLKRNPALLSNRNIEEATNQEMKENLQGQINELYKAKTLNRDILNEHRRLLRDDARLERLKDEVKEAAAALPNLPNVKPAKPVNGISEAVLLLSDLHVGMTIDSFCNKFNLDIASKRMNKLTEDTIKYCKANKVKRLNVVNLGDLIYGIIHVTIRLQEEFDAIQQTMEAAEMVARMLNRLQEAAPEVIYRSCTDNHSRLVADKNQAVEKENLYRIMDWFIEERLKTSKIRFEKDNLSPVLGKFRLMNGKLCMFAHGHLNKPNTSFQDFIGATEEYVHYVFLGHYHSEKTKYFQNMRVFINGSICGTDPYAEGIMKFTKPSQMLLIFDEDNLLNHSINLDIM